MTESTRANFFLLLELNPDETWDQARYQRALQDKIRQWSYDSTSIAKKALPAQANRALLPQIRQIMENTALREKEACEAKKLLATRYQTEHERFETQLMLLNMKEAAEQEEIDRFIKDFKHIIPAQAIEKRITAKRRRSDENDIHLPQPLDTSIAKSIKERLEIIQMPTLYDLLQSSQKNTTAVLFQAAETLYAQQVRLRPTAEVIARVELAGFAMSLFKTDEMRARYDETLRQASLQQILKDITESVKRSIVKEVHPGQVLYYLQKAEEVGWSEKEALEKLKEHGRLHQWFITIPLREPMREPGKQQSDTNTNNFIQSGGSSLLSPTHVEDIDQLQYHVLRSSIRLYWQWPEGCQAAFLSYGIGTSSIQHHTPGITTSYVSRLEYEQLGYYDIHAIQNQHYSILISAIREQNGVQAVTRGVQTHLYFHKIILTYKIQLSRLLHTRRTLCVVVDTPGLVPPLILISKSNALPLQKTDGHPFHRIEEQINKKGEMSVDLPDRPLPPETFGKLFLEDDRFYSTIIIHHPAQRQLRLS